MRWFRRDAGMTATTKPHGRLDAVVIRGGQPIKRRNNLGANLLERLRGK